MEHLGAAAPGPGSLLRFQSQTFEAAHGLSPIQLQLLLRLAVDPPQGRRPGALAREFDVSPASLSDSIAALERKGLVERRRIVGDRRGF